MLLFVYHHVLQPHQVQHVYTFGAPAVFCNTVGSGAPAAGASSYSGGGSPYLAAAQGLDHFINDSLLSMLGLSDSVIHNVIMHRDIVPRSFVCDYTSVSDLLQSWMPAFQGHTGGCGQPFDNHIESAAADRYLLQNAHVVLFNWLSLSPPPTPSSPPFSFLLLLKVCCAFFLQVPWPL